MEGLIKGLIDVALGDRGHNNQEDESNSQSRDEQRSRSSWAEVVSGDQDDNRNEQQGRSNTNRRGERVEEEEENWQNDGERQSRRPQKVVSGDYDDNRNEEQGRRNNNRRGERVEEEEENWQNAGERQSRRPQKVVSGDQDDNRNEEQGRRNNNRRGERVEEEEENWQNAGERPSRRPQKDVYGEIEQGEGTRQDYRSNKGNRKEEEEGNNEGWETVGKTHPKRPQKVWTNHLQEYKRPPSEQEYSDEVEYGSNIEPSEEELRDLSQACNKLWELDSNRLIPGKDYQIVCGEGKKVYQNEDMAQGSLFDWLSEEVFKKPTYSRFCSLLDNYNPVVGSKEEVTSQEKQEQAAFIEEISRTAPIKYLHKYLTSKGVVSENRQDFKRMMTELWFELYGRGGSSGSSSAFEHVFVGEIKTQGEDEVTGFHNWLQFYLEEAKGRVDYQGYIFPRRRGETPDSETQLLTVQFAWNGVLKSVSSTLVGVSPEFEIALYTLCFLMGGEDNHVEIGPYPVNIKCYRLGRDKIGSAFPIAES